MVYVTRQYQAVLQCVEGRGEAAFTAAELAEDLRRAGCPVGLATVYRQLDKGAVFAAMRRLEETVDKLEASGLVHKVPTQEGALYQRCPHPTGGQDCFLLRCEGCGRIVHLDCEQMEALCRHLADAHHFQIDPRRTVLTGRCQTCMNQEDAYGTP